MSEKKLELKAGHPAERAIYATRDGRLVEEGDPEASELVVGPGGVITEKMAARYQGRGAGKEIPSDAAAPASPKEHHEEQPAEPPAAEEQTKEQTPPPEEPEEHPAHEAKRRGK